MNTQIWQHKTAGERYAVALDENGAVIDVWAGLTDEDVAGVMTGEDWEGVSTTRKRSRKSATA